VRFPGFLSRPEVDRLMQESHVNLLLSESEGFGLSVLEGMKYGCVPIVTDTCGCKDAIEDRVNGFIVKLGDVEQVTARVQQLDRDRSWLARLSEASARTAREKYSFENEITRHLEILRLAREHHQHHAARTVPWKYEPASLINYPWVPNWLAKNLRRLKYGLASKPVA
jgi:glycosyltransferase involved in cell wall biosynthesis